MPSPITKITDNIPESNKANSWRYAIAAIWPKSNIGNSSARQRSAAAHRANSNVATVKKSIIVSCFKSINGRRSRRYR